MTLETLSKRWLRPFLWFSGFGIATLSLLVWRLGTLVPGTNVEVVSCQAESNGSPPMGLIYGFLQHINIHDCSLQHAFWLRLPAVLVALLSAGLFVWAIKLWLGRRAALLAAPLFITSSWFLFAGRLNSSAVMFLLVVPLTLWLYKYAQKNVTTVRVGFISVISIGLLTAITAGLWFALLLIALANRHIIGYIRRQKWWLSVLQAVVFIISLAPTAIGLIRASDQPLRFVLGGWLGWIPGLDSWFGTLQRIAAVPLRLVWRGPDNALFNIGRLPIVSVLITVMAVVGIIWVIRRTRRHTLILFICIAGLCVLFANIQLTVDGGLSLAVPFIYFLAAIGIQWLLKRWLSIFPRNPFARTVAYGIIVLAVIINISYSLRLYFVAWPHTQATQNLIQYNQKFRE